MKLQKTGGHKLGLETISKP